MCKYKRHLCMNVCMMFRLCFHLFRHTLLNQCYHGFQVQSVPQRKVLMVSINASIQQHLQGVVGGCGFCKLPHFVPLKLQITLILSQKNRTAFVVTSDRIIIIITDLLTVCDQFLNVMLALSIIVFFLLIQRLQLQSGIDCC